MNTNWIPVIERLPEGDEVLFVTVELDGRRFTDMDFFNPYYGEWKLYRDKVIAWMPLPKPYKAE